MTTCLLTEAQRFVAELLTSEVQSEKAMFHRFGTMNPSASIRLKVSSYMDFQATMGYLMEVGIAERVIEKNRGRGARWLRLKAGAVIPSETKVESHASWCSMLGGA